MKVGNPDDQFNAENDLEEEYEGGCDVHIRVTFSDIGIYLFFISILIKCL